MVRFKTAAPVKSITDNNEIKVENNTVEHFGQEWTYNVDQVIPTGIPTAHHYSSFIFEDQIESCLKITSVKVLHLIWKRKKMQTSWFDVSTDNNKVTDKTERSERK